MLKETKIQIAGIDYLVKKSYRSMLMFEELTKKSISEMQTSLSDLLMLFYCVIKTNNTVDFTYDQFIDILDVDLDAVDKFNQYLLDSARTIEEPEEPVKKKRIRKSSK
jgi:hypothetical protein